jgi:membrane-bound metal-dependent hydrolase YbcI (DUF457 family)
MDILTHAVSGLAAGVVIAGFSGQGFGGSGRGRGLSWKNFGAQVAIVAAAGLGGVLPDIDTASYLLGDGIYSAKLWYSHHGFFHSLFAAFLFALLMGLVLSWRRKGGMRGSHGFRGFAAGFSRYALLLGGFVAGFTLHLVEDMVTPASTWGGVRLFFPSREYVGGTGQIWWWNNYDLFLIACSVFVLCGILMLMRRLRWVRFVSLGIFAVGCVVCAIQIAGRETDYAYTGHTPRYAQFEEASLAEQRKILSPRLYRAMTRLDKALPVQF